MIALSRVSVFGVGTGDEQAARLKRTRIDYISLYSSFNIQYINRKSLEIHFNRMQRQFHCINLCSATSLSGGGGSLQAITHTLCMTGRA